jgi:hypothetical protein
MPDLTLSSAMDAFLAEADPADVFLPLAGGTMDDNASIIWDNASAIREAGEQGLEIECSVGYRWQWVAGRMILRQLNSGQISRILAIDGVTPGATHDSTEGFVVGTRWETVDGTVYVCSDSTEDAAVWAPDLITTGDITGLGAAATANIGTTAGTVAAGDDARFSDTRTETTVSFLGSFW